MPPGSGGSSIKLVGPFALFNLSPRVDDRAPTKVDIQPLTKVPKLHETLYRLGTTQTSR